MDIADNLLYAAKSASNLLKQVRKPFITPRHFYSLGNQAQPRASGIKISYWDEKTETQEKPDSRVRGNDEAKKLSPEAQAVLNAGRVLWQAYFTQTAPHHVREELKLNRADMGAD